MRSVPVTQSLLGMRLPWKQFLESLQCETVFLHRPQLHRQYPGIRIRVPVILVQIDGQLARLLTADEIEGVGNLAGLIQLTRGRLAALYREELDPFSEKALQLG